MSLVVSQSHLPRFCSVRSLFGRVRKEVFFGDFLDSLAFGTVGAPLFFSPHLTPSYLSTAADSVSVQ